MNKVFRVDVDNYVLPFDPKTSLRCFKDTINYRRGTVLLENNAFYLTLNKKKKLIDELRFVKETKVSSWAGIQFKLRSGPNKALYNKLTIKEKILDPKVSLITELEDIISYLSDL